MRIVLFASVCFLFYIYHKSECEPVSQPNEHSDFSEDFSLEDSKTLDFSHDTFNSDISNLAKEGEEQDSFSLFDDSILCDNSNIYCKTAKELAGLCAPDGFLNKETYDDYAQFIHEEWKNLESVSLSKIKDWSYKNIAPHIAGTFVLFYPFGGPDIAYALKFFPQIRNYVLVGLEPIGNFDDVRESIKNEHTISTLKQAFSSYLKKGYFVTSEMTTQLANKHVYGVIYLVLLELVKSGFCIDIVDNVSIDADGCEVSRQKGMIDGVKIIFTPAGGGPSKSMYYVRANLNNSNNKLIHLMNFMKHAPFVTLVKSASYAMHDRFFSQIKKFILKETIGILQDDTGIPFHEFEIGWNKYIFGEYTTPTLSTFRQYKQESLIKYYASHQAIGIPFKIGYGFNQNRPNLFLAVSKQHKVVQLINELKPGGTSKKCDCEKR